MTWTKQTGQPRWPYFPTRSSCMVWSKDTMTSWKSQLQTGQLQWRPLSVTVSICMVLPDRLSCWAGRGGFKCNTLLSTMWTHFGNSSNQPTSQSWSSTSSRLWKPFGASRYRTADKLTTRHHRTIRKSTITISTLAHWPLTLMLPIQTPQRYLPRWVDRNTWSTQGMTSGKSFWSSWRPKMPWWPPNPMRLSPCSSKRKLQSRERMGLLQKLCCLPRRVVKGVKVANIQRGRREITGTIGRRRIRGIAFIADGEGMLQRTALVCNMPNLPRLPMMQLKHRPRLLRLSPLRLRTIG